MNFMRHLFIFFIIIFTVQSGMSQGGKRGGGKRKQQFIKGYVSGKIVDSLNNEPIEFAIVELLGVRSNRQIDGDLTDEGGGFKLKEIKTGRYKLKISFIGYKTKIVDKVDLTLSNPDKKIGYIYLSPSDIKLNEVQIIDQRTLIESKIDKMVYNVAKDPTLTGGDATDVLRKVPMLSVDMDGNVSLRGSQKVKILLNGKPSGLFSDDVGEALQMFPADEIKKVEVLTSPGAKYDGEGSAGIINIVTKKGIIKGIKGSVKTFLGDKMENVRSSIAVGRGRFGANARLGLRYKLPKVSTVKFYRERNFQKGNTTLTKNGETDVSRTGFGGVLGAFYDFNAFNSINTSMRFRGRKYSTNGDFEIKNTDIDNIVIVSNRNEEGDNLRSSYSWNADYTKKFKNNKDKLLVVAAQLEGNYHQEENLKDYSLSSELERNDNEGTNKELTLQVDYTQPMSEVIKIELGAKSILRNLRSDFERILEDRSSGVEMIDNNYTDKFNYIQDVYSGYLSSTIKFPNKIGVIAGVRYEKTVISGSFENVKQDFENDYNNVLPSVTISKRFKDFSTLKLSFNERIHRPGLRQINPFINNIDPQNISFGNPKLSPELTKQVELGYSKFLKGAMVNFSVYYRNTVDVINSFLKVNSNGISETTYFNIGTSNTYGANIFSSLKLFKVLDIRGNLNLNKIKIEGVGNRSGLISENIAYNAFLSSNLNLKRGWVFEIWGFFNSPKYTLQGRRPSFSMFSIGIQKEIFKGNGKIGLRLVEPFNEYKIFKTEAEGRNFYQVNELSIPFRSIGITFSYRFGKLDFKSRKSAIRNDDLKSSGSEEDEGER